MGLTPQQKDAISIRDKTLLVSAAAGSGKTRVLTDRIILSLLGKRLPEEELESPDTPNDVPPADLSRMLIVTYTRAAAAELKERISMALNQALSENPGNEHLSKQLFLLGSAQISTIDSFFQKAVKASFEKLNIPATFRIADKNEIATLKRERMDRHLEDYYRRYAPDGEALSAVERLEGNPFARALDHLISDRSDGKLVDTLLRLFSTFTAEPSGLERLKKVAAQMEDDSIADPFSTAWGKELLERFAQRISAYLPAFRTVAGAFDELDSENQQKFGEVFHNEHALCEALADALTRASYEDVHRCVAEAREVSFPRGMKNAAKLILEPYQIARRGFQKDFSKIKVLFAYSTEEISAQLRETAAAFRMLYEFFGEYKQILDGEKKTRGIFEFPDIREMLYGLLYDEDHNPTPYAEELAAQYDVVYIDEYQDVDGIQDEIFRCVGKKCRFMVGDIKQSIYGFRGSEPRIFSEYRRDLPLYDREHPEATADAPGICIFMSSNFRCNEPVIRFTNRVCSFLFSACRDVGYLPQDDLEFKKKMIPELPAGHPAPVQLEIFEGRPRSAVPPVDAHGNPLPGTDETRWVAAEIARLWREEYLEGSHDKKSDSQKPERLRLSDIAIIVRKHDIGDRFEAALRAEGIPAVSAAQRELLHEPLFTSVLNLLRVIDNPYRDLPLMEYLISELGGFTVTEITELRRASDKNAALYDALIASGEREERVRVTLEWLEGLRKSASAEPADKFLRRLYADERIKPYASSPALLYLYDQARAAQKNAYCGLYEFLSGLTRTMEDDDASAGGFARAEDAVQIITVHHSKGLEFPVVFCVGWGTDFTRNTHSLLFHRTLGIATKVYHRADGQTEVPPVYQLLKEKIQAEESAEEIRNVYVALTRARERLYVTGTLDGHADAACKRAEEITYGDAEAILGVSTPLTWILAATGDAREPYMERHVHAYGTVPFAPTPAPPPPESEKEPSADSDLASEYAAVADRHAAFDYPDRALTTLTSKLAASKLRLTALHAKDPDGQSETDAAPSSAGRAGADVRRTPSFSELLEASNAASAADYGTAMHAFLEFCDFRKLISDGTDAECERLERAGFLSRRARTLLRERPEYPKRLLESDLLKLVLEATDLRREQKFSILIPAAEIEEHAGEADALGDAKVFVQGSIDLLLTMSDGSIILVDYKTDRVSDAERRDPALLREKFRLAHGDQLACYARAVRQLLGREPDEVRIYSVPLGQTVRIDGDV